MTDSVTNRIIDGLHQWAGVPALLLAVTVLVASAVLSRRSTGVPQIMLVIGSAAFVFERMLDVTFTFLAHYVASHLELWQSRNSWIRYPDVTFYSARNILHVLGTICFCIGFLWYALRTTRSSR